MHQFPKFTPAWNSTCFRQVLCPSSGVYSLYTQQWYMSYRFVDSLWANWFCSKAVYKPVWHIPFLSVQWINSCWWAEELPKTWRVSSWSKFGKLVHLVRFIIRKICYDARSHEHKICYDARSHEREICYDAQSHECKICYDARSHKRKICYDARHMNVKFVTMHGHMNVKFVTMHGHMNIKFVTMHSHMNVKLVQ